MARADALVLLSGGIDSTTVLALHRQNEDRVEGVFVDYGQGPAAQEWTSAQAVANQYEVRVSRIEVRGLDLPSSGEVVGRNAYLLLNAVLFGGIGQGVISLGIHAGTNYRDCGPGFVGAAQEVLDIQAGGALQIVAPLLSFSKFEIWRLARSISVPLEITYSCETQNPPACGVCPSCIDRAQLRLDD